MYAIFFHLRFLFLYSVSLFYVYYVFLRDIALITILCLYSIFLLLISFFSPASFLPLPPLRLSPAGRPQTRGSRVGRPQQHLRVIKGQRTRPPFAPHPRRRRRSITQCAGEKGRAAQRLQFPADLLLTSWFSPEDDGLIWGFLGVPWLLCLQATAGIQFFVCSLYSANTWEWNS